MARLVFLGFDYVWDGTIPQSISYIPTLPPGVRYVSPSSDTTFYTPLQAYVASLGSYLYNTLAGYNLNSSALGGAGGYGVLGGSSLAGSGVNSVAISSSLLSNNRTLYIHAHWAGQTQYTISGSSFINKEARYQIFKWGDLALRINSVVNTNNSPIQGTYIFDIMNGETVLGSITKANYLSLQWSNIKIKAALHDTTGSFYVNIDGTTGSFENINTVATTSFASISNLYMGAGYVGSAAASSGSSVIGWPLLDDVLINDTAFETTKPYGRRLSLTADSTTSGWTAVGASTIFGALTGSGYARGTNNGSYTTIVPNTFTTTSLTNVIGYQIVPGTVSNVDVDFNRKLKVGIDDGLGNVVYDPYIQTLELPTTSSYLHPQTATLFYSTGTTDFDITKSAAAQYKLRLEVI